MMAQSTKPESIAVEALLNAADVIDRWVDNEVAHYEGTDKDAIIGPQNTFDRAFDAAYDKNVESDATGDKFDLVEDLYSDVLTDALTDELAGKDAAEFYREQAKELLR